MPSPLPPLPAWESCGFRNHDLARVVEALSDVRSHAVAWYPHVLTGCELGSQFGQIGMLTVGAIIRLWEAWPRFGGACAACGAPVRGVGGGGLISKGALTGVCGCCGLVQSRWIHGCGVIASEARESLTGTAFRLVRVEGRSRDFVPLIAVLHELGASGLPSPRARGLKARTAGEKRRDYGTPRRKGD
jgi:hypothetical protein